MTEKRFYVYVHRRLADGSIFYIGKGKGGRKDHHYGKSKWWKSIANKHGWKSEIIYDCLTQECAYCIEKILINANRSKLCNISDGGTGGLSGKKKDPDHVQKVANAHRGLKRSKKTRDAISEKAKERLSDKTKHWHLTLVKAKWSNMDGRIEFADHLEMFEKFGGTLQSFKRTQSGKMRYKGWSIDNS